MKQSQFQTSFNMAQLIQVTFEISPAGAGTVARSGVQVVPMVFPQGSEPGTNIISSIEHATYTATAASGYRFEKFSFSGTATRDVDYGGGDVRHYTFTLTGGGYNYLSNPTTLSPQYSYYNSEIPVPFYLEWDRSGSHVVDQMASLHCKVIFTPETPPPQGCLVIARAVPARIALLTQVGSNPEGNPSTGIYQSGTSVQVSARSLNSDYVFIRWDDGSRQNPRAITVTSDITLTARFMRYPASNLLVNSYARSSGQLVSDPVSGKLVVDYVPSPS